MRTIPLTQGKVALVDDEDYEGLTRFKWHALRRPSGLWHAARTVKGNGTKRHVYMHRVLTRAPAGVEVDHRNGDGLDNQRRNIRLATKRQNAWNRRQRSRSRPKSSRFHGVDFVTKAGRWRAVICAGERNGIGHAKAGLPRALSRRDRGGSRLRPRRARALRRVCRDQLSSGDVRMTTRIFEDKPAVREATPLLLGIVGPSSAGKTYSALRLATGIQRVTGGDIFFIDTESRRALHYAERFKFRHLQFGAPFGSLDYLAAIEHCVAKGAKTIIVDSFSHEHESIGGVLEEHARLTSELAARWKVSEDAAQMSAWAEPKQKRRKMINAILQLNANIIFCFRAKEKLKIKSGQKPKELGFTAIAGEEFIYELVLKFLLLPAANGVPTWQSNYPGEQLAIKLPEQFRELFSCRPQLSEDIGEELARWAAGAGSKHKVETVDVEPLAKRFEACANEETLGALEAEREAVWKAATKDGQRKRLKTAADAARKRLAEAALPEPGSDG